MLFFFRSKLPVFLGSLLMMSDYLSGMAVLRDVAVVQNNDGTTSFLPDERIFAAALAALVLLLPLLLVLLRAGKARKTDTTV